LPLQAKRQCVYAVTSTEHANTARKPSTDTSHGTTSSTIHALTWAGERTAYSAETATNKTEAASEPGKVQQMLPLAWIHHRLLSSTPCVVDLFAEFTEPGSNLCLGCLKSLLIGHDRSP
jgi:hypothetical protein